MDEHPIIEGRDAPIEERVLYLEAHLAMVWDQIWWMSLPFWRRWLYAAFGYRAPIQSFYATRGWVREFVKRELRL